MSPTAETVFEIEATEMSVQEAVARCYESCKAVSCRTFHVRELRTESVMTVQCSLYYAPPESCSAPADGYTFVCRHFPRFTEFIRARACARNNQGRRLHEGPARSEVDCARLCSQMDCQSFRFWVRLDEAICTLYQTPCVEGKTENAWKKRARKSATLLPNGMN